MLDRYGAHVSFDGGAPAVRFAIPLPGITFPKGYRLRVRVIHERDQFVRGIEPVDVDLFWVEGAPLDDWEATVPLVPGAGPGHFGTPGKYLYRYQLSRDGHTLLPWFGDPFATESGTGTLSAVRVDADADPFAWTDDGWRTPEIDRLVVYELHVGEFNRDFDGVVRQIPYLRDLGVSALELMPPTNVKEQVEWGYTPLGYFAPDERYGGPDGMRRLVDAAHAHGIAVIIDAVYAHAHPEFPYNAVYRATGEPNPMMGPFAGEFFAEAGTDFAKAFTRDYFREVSRHWLDEYHVDGFRYDYVPGLWDGPVGQGYAALVFDTYRMSQAMPRFAAEDGRSRIIQCAEHLPDPAGVLSTTYSNTGWQNGLKDRAVSLAWGGAFDAFAHQLDPQFLGYPDAFHNPATGETLPVAPLQYFESHDHSRFLARIAPDPVLRDLLGEPLGDRDRWWRLQPYVIALFAGKGVPMLWQGQEFGETWSVPHGGIGRVLLSRPLHWEYFYDPPGRALIRLYRTMGRLRRDLRCLGARTGFHYVDEPAHRARGVIALHRWVEADAAGPAQHAVVLLNFWNDPAAVWVPFPRAGVWAEHIDADDAPRPPVQVGQDGDWVPVTVPPNYGAMYVL